MSMQMQCSLHTPILPTLTLYNIGVDTLTKYQNNKNHQNADNNALPFAHAPIVE